MGIGALYTRRWQRVGLEVRRFSLRLLLPLGLESINGMLNSSHDTHDDDDDDVIIKDLKQPT